MVVIKRTGESFAALKGLLPASTPTGPVFEVSTIISSSLLAAGSEAEKRRDQGVERGGKLQ